MTPTIRRTVVIVVVFCLIFTGLAYFGFKNKEELSDVITLLRTGNWLYIGAAIIAEIAYFATLSWYFCITFISLSLSITFPTVLALQLAAQTLGTITPTEFIATQILFLSHGRAAKHSIGKTIFAIFLAQITDLLSFSLLLLFSIYLLIQHNALPHYVENLSIFLFGLVSLLTIAILSILWLPKAILSLFHYLQRLINRTTRFFHIQYTLTDQTAEKLKEQYSHIVEAHQAQPDAQFKVFFIALSGHIARVLALAAVLAAFAIHMPFWQIIAVYCIGTLAWIISPIPQGIGVAEGAFSLAIISFGIHVGPATTVALAYRGIIFWLPFLLGIPSLRYIRSAFRDPELTHITE